MNAAPSERLDVRTYTQAHGSHAHAHFQILVGLDGVLELEIEGRGLRVEPGGGCVVAPGERHDFESLGGARCLVLDSTYSGWADATPAPGEPTAALAQYLAEAWEKGLPRARALGPALLFESWRPPFEEAVRPHRPIDWSFLAQWARDRWIETRVVTADLAAVVHLSPTQFAARCRKELGQSVQQWLRGLQLDHAQAQRARGFSVAEAARRGGYRSPSAYTAALRRRGG